MLTAPNGVRYVAGAAALLLMLAVSTAAVGQSAATDRSADSLLEARTAVVAGRLRCPVCQGVSIQDSPAEMAQQMRSEVKDQLRAGRTPREVEDYFISAYGEWVLLEPRPKGLNIILYLLPAAAVIGGLLVITSAVKKWVRNSSNASPTSPAEQLPEE